MSAADVVHIGLVWGGGGDALVMLQLAKGTMQAGANVRVMVPVRPETVKFQERCQREGVACERSPRITAIMRGARVGLLPALQLLHSVRAPIVHFHTGFSSLERGLMLSLELLRYRRCLVTLHDPYASLRPGTFKARFWAAFARRRFAAIVSPSRHGANLQRQCGIPSSLAVTIPNGVDAGAFSGGDGRKPRAALGLRPDDPLVVFLARIAEQKRPLEAVRIVHPLMNEIPALHLAFVGEGPQEHAVREEAARLGVGDRVHLVGYQTDVADWLAAATVWLLPTERENFSIGVLEALASGCTVLSTICPGNDEVLVDGENALTFAVGDIAAATTSLRRLLSDEALRERLGTGASATAKQYSPEVMVARYHELYSRVPHAPDVLRNASPLEENALSSRESS